jgi:type I restriction enzyme, S subunit
MDRHLGIIRISESSNVDPYYLATFLNSAFGRFQTLRESTGNVQLNLFIQKIKELRVPVGDRFNEVGNLTRKAYDKRRESESLYAEAEALLLHELELDTLDLSTQKTYVANFSETVEGDRFDAEYFHPEKRHIQEQLNNMSGKSIGYYFTSINESLNPPAKDIGEKVYNYDLNHALKFFLNEDDVDLISTFELGSTKKRFQENDVVISRLRSYLNEITIAKNSSQYACVGSSEFFVFRSINHLVIPELLLVYLKSSPIQKILKWCQDGSNHPRFKDDELLELKLPDCLFGIQKEVQNLIHQGISVHQEAKLLLEQAKLRVEEMILG